MASISDVINKLKTTVIQTKTSAIDAKLDAAVDDIVSYRSNSGRNGYIDIVRNLIAKNADVHISSSGGGLFSQGGVTPATFGQGARLYRYKSYQAIVSNINYAYRALEVLTDNILSPDDITKQVLEIKPQNQLTDDTTTDSSVRYVKDVVKYTELERKLETIVHNTLLSGDLFCEIGSAKTALTSQTLLSEGLNYQQKISEQFENGTKVKIRQKVKLEESKQEGIIEFNIDYSSLTEVGPKIRTSKDNKKGRKKNLKNLHLIFHDPQFVVKLQSSLFPVCFGYLAFPIRAAITGSTLADDAINNICVAIIKNLKNKLPQMAEYKDDEELQGILSALVRNTDLNKSMEIRYVSPDKMVHFHRPSNKYAPYGESIFDSVQYTAKVLISLETALAVQRLARSTEKRKIAIEVGLPRDAKKAVEAMKEEFRKRKVSLDSFGTVDTIPSMISTFEDVYIPQKDGKPFVDISTFTEGNVDVRSKVDELKFMRDQMVASLGVPPSFIGIEENLSNKNALTEENILFARTIISHQKYLTHQLQELIQKIFDIIDPQEALTILDDVNAALPTPRSLQFEREARYMNELSTLVENLERIGIPKEYSAKKYLSQIDWDEVKKYDISQKIDQTIDPSKKDDDGMGGMGGGMAGGFGGGM